MGKLKPIGSEKLTGKDKVKRIMEIARYGETKKMRIITHKLTHSIKKELMEIHTL